MTSENGRKRDHYEILELSRDASATQIRSAYLRLAATVHPDRGGTPEAFDDLQKAYNILSNDLFKAAYDDQLPKPSIARRQEPLEQFGVAKGVHVRVHGQTGMTAEERSAELERNIRQAQEDQELATDEEWRERDAQAALMEQRRGNAAFRAGDYELAVHNNRSAAFALLGRFTRSLADAEEALEHKPNWSKAHLRRGVACYHLQQYMEAVEALSQARKLASEAGDSVTAAAAEEHLALSQDAQAKSVQQNGGEAEATIAEVRAQLGAMPPIASNS
eukprot:CAMPEP_0114322352 /NCGR_PEP_ID=MMETSP0059-20121206/27179_1 /TAXON_ID=36894 /ORGANISM="Pyramimonas parkeae, Strain CCMP726" /LENGTH=275 /DNA_ID=CAMNT_0001450321 /DNA_START=326 /DNA_END=1154 /DNA_ORIENTATION=+